MSSYIAYFEISSQDSVPPWFYIHNSNSASVRFSAAKLDQVWSTAYSLSNKFTVSKIYSLDKNGFHRSEIARPADPGRIRLVKPERMIVPESTCQGFTDYVDFLIDYDDDFDFISELVDPCIDFDQISF